LEEKAEARRPQNTIPSVKYEGGSIMLWAALLQEGQMASWGKKRMRYVGVTSEGISQEVFQMDDEPKEGEG